MYSCRLPWRLPSLSSPRHISQNAIALVASHPFGTSCPAGYKAGSHLPPRPTLADADIKETYVKGTGPGGQKINKTNSAAQLTHVPTGIVVKSQATRSKNQNYSIARKLLAEKVEMLEKGSDSRAARVVERKSKKRRSADKKKRRKYRELAGQKDDQEGEIDEDLDEDDDVEEVAADAVLSDKLETPVSGNGNAVKE